MMDIDKNIDKIVELREAAHGYLGQERWLIDHLKACRKVLKKARDHFNYYGYGNKWERESERADELSIKMTEVLDGQD